MWQVRHLVSVGLTSPLQGEVVDVSNDLSEGSLRTVDHVLVRYEHLGASQ